MKRKQRGEWIEEEGSPPEASKRRRVESDEKENEANNNPPFYEGSSDIGSALEYSVSENEGDTENVAESPASVIRKQFCMKALSRFFSQDIDPDSELGKILSATTSCPSTLELATSKSRETSSNFSM